MSLTKESFFIKLNAELDDKIHLKRIYDKSNSQNKTSFRAVLCVHGVMENGRIFYSRNDKGIAPYLANQGFDVFIPDLRGKGQSVPKVNAKSKFGQDESFLEDLPEIAKYIKTIRGDFPEYIVAHSWGGVISIPFLIRMPELRQHVCKMVFFGSKRRIRTKSLEKTIKIDLVWNRLSKIICAVVGYFPNTKIGLGTDDESCAFMKECNAWIYQDAWIGKDGFDYQNEIQKLHETLNYFPPILHFAAKNDTILGNPNDVKLLKQELNNINDKYVLLSKENNNRNDYDHNTMLTHKEAIIDHFPLVLDWFKE